MEICNVDFFCNAIMVSLLHVHTKRTGWEIRSQPKTVILKTKMIQMPCREANTSKKLKTKIRRQMTKVTTLTARTRATLACGSRRFSHHHKATTTAERLPRTEPWTQKYAGIVSSCWRVTPSQPLRPTPGDVLASAITEMWRTLYKLADGPC